MFYLQVEESMKNLEDVVRERNRAYFELETGETGERRCKYELTRIGKEIFSSLVKCFFEMIHSNTNSAFGLFRPVA